jgi:uridine kinase
MNPNRITKILRRRIVPSVPFIVGIDGCGGAGKSILADEISQALTTHGHAVDIVRTDDFYLPSAERQGGASAGEAPFDWQPLEEQVLKPAARNEPFRFQRYDWTKDALAEWRESPAPVFIVEGVYCTRIDLDRFYDFTIWLDCPRATHLARGVERDGESARDRWVHQWMPPKIAMFWSNCRLSERRRLPGAD